MRTRNKKRIFSFHLREKLGIKVSINWKSFLIPSPSKLDPDSYSIFSCSYLYLSCGHLLDFVITFSYYLRLNFTIRQSKNKTWEDVTILCTVLEAVFLKICKVVEDGNSDICSCLLQDYFNIYHTENNTAHIYRLTASRGWRCLMSTIKITV